MSLPIPVLCRREVRAAGSRSDSQVGKSRWMTPGAGLWMCVLATPGNPLWPPLHSSVLRGQPLCHLGLVSQARCSWDSTRAQPIGEAPAGDQEQEERDQGVAPQLSPGPGTTFLAGLQPRQRSPTLLSRWGAGCKSLRNSCSSIPFYTVQKHAELNNVLSIQ